MNPPILVLGYANADLVARVSHLPKDGERITAEQIDLFAGGMAANCACAAAQQGGKVIFFGSVADDPFGQFLIDDLERHKVDITQVERCAPRTTKSIILVSPSGERAIVSEPVTYNPVPLQQFLSAFEGTPGALYLDGYHLCTAEREVSLAKERGFTIYCDLDGAPDTYSQQEISSALAYVDIVQWNPSVAASVFPALESEAAELELMTYVGVLITTRGAQSVRVLERGNSELKKSPIQCAELPVPLVENIRDTTGAGDTFAGTFLHAYLKSRNVQQAVRIAVNAASEITRHPGARPTGTLRTW